MLRLLLLTLSVFGIHGATIAQQADRETAPSAELDGSFSHDGVLLEVVLEDLSSYEAPNRPHALIKKAPRDIYFLRRVSPYEPRTLVPLDDKDVWSQMDSAMQKDVRHAVADLYKKAVADRGRGEFESFRPPADVIHVVDDISALKSSQKRDGAPHRVRLPTFAWRPGYSSDKSTAVVHLYFPEVLHSWYATYVLIRKHERWQVAHRAFVWY